MSRLAILIFILVGPTLAGLGALVAISIGSVNAIDWKMLVGAAVIGLIVAIPLSIFVAKKIEEQTRPTA